MSSRRSRNNGMRRRNRNNRRRKTSLVMNSQGMSGAPVGISQDLQQFTRFIPTSNGQGIRMHTCVAISELMRESTSPQGAGILLPGPTAGMSLQLNLTEPAILSNLGAKTNTEYISPVFDLIASSFVRYRVRSLIFHYEPQASATTTERLVFAFAEDPLHPILWNGTVPTQNSLLALADSVAFAPWRAWSMNVTDRLNNTLFYTYSDTSTTVGQVSERFSDFGVISCVTSSNTGTNTACGVLYMELDVELIEFCPIVTTSPSSKIGLKMLKSRKSTPVKEKQDLPEKKSTSEEKQSSDLNCSPDHGTLDFLMEENGVKNYSCNTCGKFCRDPDY